MDGTIDHLPARHIGFLLERMPEVDDVPLHPLQGLDRLFAVLGDASGKLDIVLQNEDVVHF